MKLIHTADWHLGQTFYEYDRRDEHAAFFAWLRKQIATHQPDLLLVAGDIYDSANPSAESQRTLYDLLVNVTKENPQMQVIITAGNHDSGARLEAPNALLESLNITVRGTIRRNAEGKIDLDHLIIPIEGGGACLAVPYLRQGDYPKEQTSPDEATAAYEPDSEMDSFPEGSIFAQPIAAYQTPPPPAEPTTADSTQPTEATDAPDTSTEEPTRRPHDRGVQRLYDALYARAVECGYAPIIAMGHLQASGAMVSDNDHPEHAIIGGLEAVSPDAFDEGITYTALGHLHRAQRVGGRTTVRYSGAPLPMTFAERNNTQGVMVATIDTTAPHSTALEWLTFDTPRKLLRLPAEPQPINEVLAALTTLPDGTPNAHSPYLEVRVAISQPEPSLRHQIDNILKHKAVRLARLEAVIPRGDRPLTNPLTYEELREIDPMTLADEVYKRTYGQEQLPDKMRALLQSIINETAE